MAESDGKQNFWTTIPGILTGLAALLTAGTGLFLALNHPHDQASSADHASPVAASSPAAQTSSNPATPGASTAKEGVIVTSRSGEATRLSLKTFRHGVSGKGIELTSGQTIPFEKIRTIEFQTMSGNEVAVNVTLTDGRVIPGSLSVNALFEGDNDIGPFNIYISNVKQIAFQP